MDALYRKISELSPWDNNPRAIKEEDFTRLKKQIQRLGQYKPLLITKEGTVLGGNMRLRAYRELGINEAWVSVVDAPDDKTKLEYALSDNDRAGYYDEEKLAELVFNTPELDLSEFKVDLGGLTTLEDVLKKFGPDGEIVEDTPPEVSTGPAFSVVGEIYQLGRHRLMCGDATKSEDVQLLMNGAQADMVFTDPPYNVSYEGKTKDKLKIQNDKQTAGGFYDFLAAAYKSMFDASKDGASIYVCHADMERVNFTKAFVDTGWKLSEIIIWAKHHFVMGHNDYHWQHEPILYGWKEGESHYYGGGRDQTTVWNIHRPMASLEHPTMKPIELMVKALQNSSKGGDIVLDLFGGSGSTLIAAEQTNRVCYTMELDPKYCDVIRKRYAILIQKGEEWQTATPPIQ
jgi:DNA modification methylase